MPLVKDVVAQWVAGVEEASSFPYAPAGSALPRWSGNAAEDTGQLHILPLPSADREGIVSRKLCNSPGD